MLIKSSTCKAGLIFPGGLSGKFELEESLEVMLGVIKLVNDSLHQPNIKGLPEELFPLGSLIYQETFLVLTIKSQSQACQHSLNILLRFCQAKSQNCQLFWMLTTIL